MINFQYFHTGFYTVGCKKLGRKDKNQSNIVLAYFLMPS